MYLLSFVPWHFPLALLMPGAKANKFSKRTHLSHMTKNPAVPQDRGKSSMTDITTSDSDGSPSWPPFSTAVSWYAHHASTGARTCTIWSSIGILISILRRVLPKSHSSIHLQSPDTSLLKLLINLRLNFSSLYLPWWGFCYLVDTCISKPKITPSIHICNRIGLDGLQPQNPEVVPLTWHPRNRPKLVFTPCKLGME